MQWMLLEVLFLAINDWWILFFLVYKIVVMLFAKNKSLYVLIIHCKHHIEKTVLKLFNMKMTSMT